MSHHVIDVTLIGATHLAATEIISALAESSLEIGNLRLMDTPEQTGTLTEFRDRALVVSAVDPDLFRPREIIILTREVGDQRHLVTAAVTAGARIIDCSGGMSLNPGVPLVTGGSDLALLPPDTRIAATPNPLAAVVSIGLKNLALRFGIKSITATILTGYAAAGRPAMDILLEQTRSLLAFESLDHSDFSYQLAFNCISARDTGEPVEWGFDGSRITAELRRMLRDDRLPISLAVMWVPVFMGMAVSCQVMLEAPADIAAIEAALTDAGCHVVSDFASFGECSTQSALLAEEVRAGGITAAPLGSDGARFWLTGDYFHVGLSGPALSLVRWFADRLGEEE
ncbi:hypothetical protein JW905_07375 [bacterium]|nr:hypothetical protein [candidate division CSSED10-310 bacterium]